MVYDATRSGLNKVVWSPWFPMPTAASLFRSAEAGTYMEDCDISEMFLDLILDPAIRPHTSVDFTNILKEKVKTTSGASKEVI